MRAFAAFSVVLIHSGGGGLRSLGDTANHIVDLCSNGVTVFFVISGYSVASSYLASDGYGEYLNKRFWRIAPLYYFWIALAVLTSTTASYWQEHFHVNVGLYNLLMHISFLSFLDYKVTASILGVEWTIPIEVFWYLLVPYCLPLMKSHKRMVIALVLCLASYVLSTKCMTYLPIPSADASLALHWNPIPYALSFGLGITSYRLRESSVEFTRWGNVALLICVVSLVAFIVLPLSKSSDIAYVFFSVISMVLIIFGSNNSSWFRGILTNKVAMFLGTISYGIYLCHMPILAALSHLNIPSLESRPLQFVIVSVSAVAVATVTYFLIERPGVLVGKSLAVHETRKTRPHI
jgi:peptidoglycan/LPS O-acetylase OafA/YrhL